jgi:hypothetical protein
MAAVRGGGACRGGERVWEHGRVQRDGHRGSGVGFIVRGRREGATAGVMAMNGHGGRRLQGIQEGET